MIKSVFAATAALSMSAGAAFAGPYVNIENNAGFTGSEYDAAVTETHVGFDGAIGESASWYVQGGPAFLNVDGEENTTELSGKIGLGYDVTERLNIYGEVAAMTNDEINFDEDLNVGTKVGVKFSF
jgi:hypothetical protein